MSATAIPFHQLSSEMGRYLAERAGNYDSYNALDLWQDIPEKLKHSEDAVMSFLRGNEALGVEAREVMHLTSRFNGGADTPDNLMLGPESLNGEISSANMSAWDINQVMDSNADAVESILDADPDVLVDAWEGLSYVASATASTSEAASTIFEGGELTGEILPSTIEAGPAAEIGGDILGDVGGALLEGLVPAMAAYRVGSYVADNCDTPDVDPTAAAWAAAGGTVLLYCNPITGPLAWGATAVYSGFKLLELGCKVVDHVNRSSQSA